MWRRPQVLQSAAEHERLWDPVACTAGLQDQVEVAPQQREKASGCVAVGAVIYPVIGQHSCQ